MQRGLIILAGIALAVIACAPARASDTPVPPPISCNNGLVGGINCIPSKKDLKQARAAFDRGVKLNNRSRLDEAFAQFDEAARLAPQNAQFLTAREAVKARLVFDHVEHGNTLLMQGAGLRAAAEFRAALDLDPDNPFVRERFQTATFEPPPPPAPPVFQSSLESSEIHLQPPSGRATFHFSGNVKDLFTQLAASYSMTVQFDDSVQARPVVFNVDDLDFLTALNLACRVSKLMWAPLDAHQFIVAVDNPENHKQYDRMAFRSFVLPPHASPAETQELINTLRTVFDLHNLSPGQTSGTLEVRGPQASLEACSQLIAQLSNEKPQVMLDIRVFQISHQLTRNMGVHIPNTFNLYNITAAAIAGLGGQNLQQLINQLVSSGGVNSLGSSSLAGLLSQLGGQQNSIFSQPLATFGGGLTLMGLSLDHLAAELSVNESWVRSLENMQLRAEQGNDATFHLGERFPVQNASYAPIYNSPQISQVLGNQSYVPPFPSVTYEDLGLNVKAKPTIHGDGSVTLVLELQVRSLTGQSTNGVPVISNREYKGSITLGDGEPAFVAGEVSRSDMLSMSGIPGFGFVPGLNMAMVNNTKQTDEDELMIAITPHVVSNYTRSSPEIWLTQR